MVNPYAAPKSSLDELPIRSLDSTALDEALRRLDEHLAIPANVTADDRLDDGWVPRPTLIAFAVLGLLAVAIYGFAASQGATGAAHVLGIPIVFTLSIVALVVLARAVRIGPRSRATKPGIAALQHFRAMVVGRAGTVAAGLCPSAREESVQPPRLPPTETGAGTFELSNRREVVRFLKTFARTGASQVRWVKVKKLVSVEVDAGNPNVAVCRLMVAFRTWPQWANYLSVGLFLVVNFIGMFVALVLYYALSKRRTVTFDKTFIRGRDGLWYAALPDPIERIVK